MAITFGSTSAPSNITTYLDSIFSQSLANYRKTLIDNIGATNAVLYEILKGDAYESADGGTYIAYNMKEVYQNQHKLVDLVKSRIQQSEMGIQEGWARAFLWGSAPQVGGSLRTPLVDPTNTASAVEPLAKLVDYNNNVVVGNIDS